MGGLAAGSAYEFRIAATNLVGIGQPSDPSELFRCEAWTAPEPGEGRAPGRLPSACACPRGGRPMSGQLQAAVAAGPLGQAPCRAEAPTVADRVGRAAGKGRQVPAQGWGTGNLPLLGSSSLCDAHLVPVTDVGSGAAPRGPTAAGVPAGGAAGPEARLHPAPGPRRRAPGPLLQRALTGAPFQAPPTT